MAYPMYPHFVNECVRQPFTWQSPIAGLLALALIWSLAWKGFALWKAARNNHIWWYVALLVINTVGLLEILYIFAFANRGKRSNSGTISSSSSSQLPLQ